MKSSLRNLLIVSALAGACLTASAQVNIGLDPNASWQGFMNVFEIPQNGGGYVFGSSWGTGDLRASFSGTTLTLAANTIGDPNAFWYSPSGGPGAIGNKTMDANMYVETTGTFAGQTVNFSALVLNNNLVGQMNQLGNGWTAVAFIKDFAPDYSSSVTVTAPLTAGAFNLTLNAINDPNRHVQYGFEVMGPDVWAGDPLSFNQIQVVPEPSSLALLGLGAFGVICAWRRRK
jgi:PEP-CTERM motif